MPQVEDGRPRTDSFSLDVVLVRIGQFGKLQILIYILICIPILLNSFQAVSYIFVASTVVHRCQIPECDKPNSTYQESWIDFAIPKKLNGDLDNCRRYVSVNKNLDPCSADAFHQSPIEECGTDLIFRDKEVTISNDFDIFCSDEWKLAMVGTINNVGMFIGIPLGGYFADRYGRKNILAIFGFLSAVTGVAQCFTTDFFTFMFFGLLTNLFGSSIYSIVFVLGLEMVSPKLQLIGCTIMTIVYAIGQTVFGLVAKYFLNWRLIQMIFFIPALFQIFFLFIIPESARWLLSQGEEDRAVKVVQKLAKSNNRKLSQPTLDKLVLTYRYKLEESNEGKFPIKETFQILFWRIVNCCLCWFTNVLLYYGLNVNMVLLGGNKYDNFMLVSLIEIPGILLPFWTMNRFGRRYSLFGFMILSGICIAATVFVRSELFYVQVALLLLGKMSVGASFQVLYFFTSEIFPTNVRNSLLSFCSMVGRLGSMVAPQTPVMAKYHESAPAILFSACALLSGFLAFLFPETNDTVLPSTLKEAEKIGQKKELEADAEIQLLKTIS
ncbi:organic cation transporter protein-like [Eupeodes corollae]|uniref:organic cation transporter protein-like n=1 Tax=Eupeodes corollae TaxID=290404 RepID=UPI00248FBBAD|nr:organic cation transporter protein-like [Eupeodes corollae]